MDRTEEEQLETLKRWWNEYGKSVIAGVIIGLIVLFGGGAWLQYQSELAREASQRYERVTTLLEQGDPEVAVDLGQVLVRDYAATPYAALVSLRLARYQIDQGKPDQARAHLEWVVEEAAQTSFQRIARLRLARLLLAGGEHDAALAQLAPLRELAGYRALAEELRGDVLRASGDVAGARAAYQAALNALGDGTRNRFLVELKLDDVAPAAGEGASEPDSGERPS